MNNASKITVPSNVANAIAHYVALADSKHEAFTDILRFGYEAANSEIILRHFAHDFDELMEALICGYEVEKTPEDLVREYYKDLMRSQEGSIARYQADSVAMTLNILGIFIEGVND